MNELVVLILMPLVLGVSLMLIPRDRVREMKIIGLIGSFGVLVWSLYLWIRFNNLVGGYQFVFEQVSDSEAVDADHLFGAKINRLPVIRHHQTTTSLQ